MTFKVNSSIFAQGLLMKREFAELEALSVFGDSRLSSFLRKSPKFMIFLAPMLPQFARFEPPQRP